MSAHPTAATSLDSRALVAPLRPALVKYFLRKCGNAAEAEDLTQDVLVRALGNWRQSDVELNGGPAFGAGLQEWLAHAPGFNAEHIHTPLLITGQSGGLLMIIGEWEIYSRMRHLNKPAQIYMMPQADKHPSHTPQNPEQIIAIQDAALDWFDFWLTGREDPSPIKRDQYVRWRAFRASQTGPLPNNGKDP
jgi:hypothetical protein